MGLADHLQPLRHTSATSVIPAAVPAEPEHTVASASSAVPVLLQSIDVEAIKREFDAETERILAKLAESRGHECDSPSQELPTARDADHRSTLRKWINPASRRRLCLSLLFSHFLEEPYRPATLLQQLQQQQSGRQMKAYQAQLSLGFYKS